MLGSYDNWIDYLKSLKPKSLKPKSLKPKSKASPDEIEPYAVPREDYPHTCPVCGEWSRQDFVIVYCSNPKCTNWDGKIHRVKFEGASE